MTKKEIFKQFKTEREEGGYNIDNDLLNVACFLAYRDKMPVKDIDDVALIYDNLEINGEIIHAYDFEEYDIKTLENIIGHKKDYILKQLYSHFYILSYYKLYTNTKNYNDVERIETVMKFKENYNFYNF